MSSRRWSLASRLTQLFALLTSALVLVIALASSWFLRESTNRELDGLLVEELNEAMAVFYRKGVTGSSGSNAKPIVREITGDLQSQHKSNPMAWRVWDQGSKTVVGEFGELGLLSPEFPLIDVLGSTKHEGKGMRWRSEALGNGLILGLVLDGSNQLLLLEQYQLFGGALVLISMLLILCFGGLFIRRASRMLRTVAESVRAVRQPEEAMRVDVANAPDEIREVVDALHGLLENVRKENERARVFTASVAHELRSPIQNLVGETEVALICERDAAVYRGVLESHLEELRDLGDAVDNLVTICSARNLSLTDSQTRESFDLASEAELRLARERAYAKRHGVELRLESAGDTRLVGDREGLLRALRNLTANAIEWSYRGGAVEVRLEGDNGRVIVTVDDEGPGVPEELREQIFDPFFRGPSAQGRRIGYGLGLAIVRSAVQSQGGVIEVGTSPAGGARFRLVLPRP